MTFAQELVERHGLGRARCRGTRLLHLQLLAAATAVNLKRLIAAQDAATRGDAQDQTPRTRAADQSQGPAAHRISTIHAHTRLLLWTLNEISRLPTTDRSTGS